MTESTGLKLVDYAINAAVIAATVGFGVSIAGMGLRVGTDEYYKSRPAIESKNICGGAEPETYVTVNGVKYFSKVDGKDISDVVRK